MKQILMVDDDNLYRCLAKRYLTNMEYEIKEAEDGEAGLKMIMDAEKHDRQYSLVLLDINMPVMSGIDVIERLIKAEIYVPVIIVSGCIDEQMTDDLKQKSLVDFMEKPFDEDGFMSLINKIRQRLSNPMIRSAITNGVNGEMTIPAI